MKKFFLIGDFPFSLDYPEGIVLPEHFLCFEREALQPEYDYQLRLVDTLPEPVGEPVTEREDIRIYQSGELEGRLIGSKFHHVNYAYYCETSERSAEIYILADWAGELTVDTMFCGLLALERRMAQKQGLVLHCAYIRYKGEAILFSAPSETGKTTQANLWEQYRGSETINGDKSLLQKVDGRWMAQGWPVCGSSGVCNDEATPIRAIVMLSQAKENHAKRLPPIAAFPQLYSQITANTWNRDFVAQNMSLIENLIADVPVYHLGCTISEDAVECLWNAIFGSDQA